MILVIQFRQAHDPSREHEQQCITSRLPKPEPIRFCSVFEEPERLQDPETLLYGVDKLILGGNGAIPVDFAKGDDLLDISAPVLRYVLAADFPTLGTCFGHQLLSHAAGSEVVPDQEQAETGAFQITLTPEGRNDPLFRGVPDTFFAIEGHQDSVNGTPRGATLLASSHRCQSQVFRYGTQVYSTQFHSELDEQDLAYRLQLFPKYREHTTEDSLTIPPSPYSVAPLRNFLLNQPRSSSHSFYPHVAVSSSVKSNA